MADLHFYMSGNTSQGFTSLLISALQDTEYLFLIEGNPSIERGSFIDDIAASMKQAVKEYWLIHSPSDNSSLDGIIFPELRAAVVSNAAASHLSPSQLPEHTKNIDLTKSLDKEQISSQQTLIEELEQQIKEAHERAYAGFANALRIHDDWEAIYIANMNLQAANQLAQTYIHRLFGERLLNRVSKGLHRFLGAATPLGPVDFVPNLTAGLKRYLIKGRAGTGKSTFLKKIAAEGLDRGFDMEFYHCGFDPGSLDMVICRELGFAVFDSTAPHEYFPDRSTDEIIDMYAYCVTPGTDELHADAITALKEQYSTQMKASTAMLAESIEPQNRLKSLYAAATDETVIQSARSHLLRLLNDLPASGSIQ